MNEKEYQEFLKKIPDHKSDEFLIFLMNNNTVVKDSSGWLIIENCKYHTADKPHWTAFWKWGFKPAERDIGQLFQELVPLGWCMFEKEVDKKSINRVHFHIKPV